VPSHEFEEVFVAIGASHELPYLAALEVKNLQHEFLRVANAAGSASFNGLGLDEHPTDVPRILQKLEFRGIDRFAYGYRGQIVERKERVFQLNHLAQTKTASLLFYRLMT
jgi:hypothetical protein